MTDRPLHEVVVDLLGRRGVGRIYGNPGTTELGLLSRLPPKMEYVLCLHESIAVGAAIGHALASDGPSVVNLHALPGLGHATGMLHGARLMHAPVVAIVGQQSSGHLRREPLLSGDLVGTARSAVLWAAEPGRPEDVAPALERAFRFATAPPRGPVVVAVPMDFWDSAVPPVRVLPDLRSPVVPPDLVAAITDRLATAESPALVIGDRVRKQSAQDALVHVAETLGIPAYSAPIGSQPGFPTDHENYRGNLALSASAVRRQLAAHDLVVVVGAPVFTMYLDDGSGAPVPDDADVILVTDDVAEASRAEVTDVALGDPEAFLVDLGLRVAAHRPRPRQTPSPSVPQDGEVAALARIASTLAPADCIFIDESMTSGDGVRRGLAISGPRTFIRTSNGVLGTGLSAAIGAAEAMPGRRVVAFVGDGSFLFAPQALWTLARRGLPVTVVVLDNGGYESLRGFEQRLLGHRTDSFDITGVDFGVLARSFDIPEFHVDGPNEFETALSNALAMAGPSVVHVTLASGD